MGIGNPKRAVNRRTALVLKPGVFFTFDNRQRRLARAERLRVLPRLQETGIPVLLDVQLPDGAGFDVVREIGPQRMPAVIFVTAYDKYAIQAFEVNAVDHLLKPFDESRLRRVSSAFGSGCHGRRP